MKISQPSQPNLDAGEFLEASARERESTVAFAEVLLATSRALQVLAQAESAAIELLLKAHRDVQEILQAAHGAPCVESDADMEYGTRFGTAAAASGLASPKAMVEPRTSLVPRIEASGVDLMLLTASRANLVVSRFESFREVNAYLTALASVSGVRDVQTRRFHKGDLYLSVDYEGIVPLSDRLRDVAGFSPEIVFAEGGTLQVVLKTGYAERASGE